MNNNIFCFWRRLFAFSIDYFIIFIFNLVICNLFFDTLVKIGNWSLIIGFLSFILYFGIMNSEIFLGQTIGKRILKIKVVNSNNNYLSIEKSLIRSAIILTMFLSINKIYFEIIYGINDLIFALSEILILANILLFLFNVPTRKLVHDFVVNSVVVDKNTESILEYKICDLGKFYLSENKYFNIEIKQVVLLILILCISFSLIGFKKHYEYGLLRDAFNKQEIKDLYNDIKILNNDYELISYTGETGWYKDKGITYLPKLRISIKTKNKCPSIESVQKLINKNLKTVAYKEIFYTCGQAAITGIYTKAVNLLVNDN